MKACQVERYKACCILLHIYPQDLERSCYKLLPKQNAARGSYPSVTQSLAVR